MDMFIIFWDYPRFKFHLLKLLWFRGSEITAIDQQLLCMGPNQLHWWKGLQAYKRGDPKSGSNNVNTTLMCLGKKSQKDKDNELLEKDVMVPGPVKKCHHLCKEIVAICRMKIDYQLN